VSHKRAEKNIRPIQPWQEQQGVNRLHGRPS